MTSSASSVTLTVLCEGKTERNFVQNVLGPHLRSRKIYAKPVLHGGNITLSALHDQVNRALSGGRSHEFITTMFDFYKLGRFPENKELANETPRERVSRIESAFEHKD
jgi:hypothetical protein